MKIIEVTDENFEQVISTSGKTVLVDFSAEWCAPCRAMAPVLELVADAVNGRAIVGKLDVDANPQTTAKYGVRNLPTFLIFKDGNLVDRIIGAVPNSILEQKVTLLQ
jgi:thioredoxin 1